MKFQTVKGMDDLFPPQIEKWQILEDRTQDFLEAYGFREIRTPLLESTELFQRSIGEASDIVHKEMYTFQDRGGRSLTLRPEMTACVVRAVIEHNLMKENEPLFLYYFGPMFRAERPQAGRKRQFHQIGIETLNTHSAVNDAELIILVHHFFSWLDLRSYTFKLNHLGSTEDKNRYSMELIQYFKSVQSKLCSDCQFRLEHNVLRIFDCKVESCQPLINQAPKPKLSGQAKSDFGKIVAMLKEAKVPFVSEPKLVRGLDYYTGVVFEATAEALGSQDALLAGGRYDSLIHDLGGPAKGASGLSIGVERLLTMMDAQKVDLSKSVAQNTVYVAALVDGEDTCSFYRTIARALVNAKKRAHFSFLKGSISSHLSRANKMKVGYVLIVGEEEWKTGDVSLKRMDSGEQKKIKPEALARALSGL